MNKPIFETGQRVSDNNIANLVTNLASPDCPGTGIGALKVIAADIENGEFLTEQRWVEVLNTYFILCESLSLLKKGKKLNIHEEFNGKEASILRSIIDNNRTTNSHDKNATEIVAYMQLGRILASYFHALHSDRVDSPESKVIDVFKSETRLPSIMPAKNPFDSSKIIPNGIDASSDLYNANQLIYYTAKAEANPRNKSAFKHEMEPKSEILRDEAEKLFKNILLLIRRNENPTYLLTAFFRMNRKLLICRDCSDLNQKFMAEFEPIKSHWLIKEMTSTDSDCPELNETLLSVRDLFAEGLPAGVKDKEVELNQEKTHRESLINELESTLRSLETFFTAITAK
jgi:hypothetical protein